MSNPNPDYLKRDGKCLRCGTKLMIPTWKYCEGCSKGMKVKGNNKGFGLLRES